MDKDYNPLLLISGWVAPTPSEPPTKPDEVFANAVAEHLKHHTNDGLALFVFGTLDSSASKWYLYPASAVDADTAFYNVQLLHESRGLQASCEWSLLFVYEGAGQPDTLIQ